ncbi:MAG: TlyA family RNA methyltransferase, partial [Desulfatiglans sp.]|nr:TlyA family RNA methyltransferase [Desulfatiglans sp.]
MCSEVRENGKIRLDQLLVRRGLAESREKAKALIMAGLVMVETRIVDKPGRLVLPSACLSLKEEDPFVSRGGYKLEAALKHFSVDVNGLSLLDVGASTGGFTDCLLQHGAQKVIAIDVGYGQLHWKLRQDARVEIKERTNARYLKPEDIRGPLDGAVIDVSFISLRLILPPISDLLKDHAFVIALIKPQFEVGKGQVEKGGIVRSPALHRDVLDALKVFFVNSGWVFRGHITSPLLGAKGNKEFLAYL